MGGCQQIDTSRRLMNNLDMCVMTLPESESTDWDKMNFCAFNIIKMKKSSLKVGDVINRTNQYNEFRSLIIVIKE